MGYERYPRNSRLGDYYGRSEDPDFSGDYGSGRDYSYSSARQYQAVGAFNPERSSDRDYGPREYGHDRYAQRDRFSAGRGSYQGGRGYASEPYRGSYADDGHRFADIDRSPARSGMDARDRGFLDRAGDEVRSWFGDEEAERRREMDARRDAQYGRHARDADYHNWRRSQIDALDRDYDEYRAENRSKFENEFGSWRSERQGQRGLLSQVTEHMEVIGSDGAHVGKVDKVRGDRIVLTKSDQDADGHHHSIPSRWLQSVDDKVTLRKTADEARAHWKDEERNRAMFGGDRESGRDDRGEFRTDHNLNRSFPGTY